MNIYDTPEAEKARQHFLTMYEAARGWLKSRAPTEAAFIREVKFAADGVMRGSDRQKAVTFARRAVAARPGAVRENDQAPRLPREHRCPSIGVMPIPTTSPTPRPRRLISLWSPWWWFILFHSKRCENRKWSYLPNPKEFGEWIWLHASLSAGEDVQKTIDDVLLRHPLREGQERPTAASLATCAGHIVGMARVVRVQINTAEIVAKDPWAVFGQVGLVLDDVRPFDMPIPWKGGQGFVSVAPTHVEIARILTAEGGVFCMGDGSKANRALLDIVPPDTLRMTLETMTALGQLQARGDVFAVRTYPKKHLDGLRLGVASPPMDLPKSAGPRQQGWGW